MKQKLIMTKGLPASGKTTWALDLINKDSSYVNVCKDDIRRSLFNMNYTNNKEKLVVKTRDAMIRTALGNQKNVICSDTNLNPVHEQTLRQIAKEFNAVFEIKDFTDIPLETCVKRDRYRPSSIGRPIIVKMYNDYLRPPVPEIEYDFGKYACYIFDLDGTLALHTSGRSPYDYSRVEEDTVNTAVGHILLVLNSWINAEIVFMSGRSDICFDATKRWIERQFPSLTNYHLFMREDGDNRADYIVKKELYQKHVEPFWNVNCVFDDRDSVVKMWRDLGLPVFQVAEGDF